MAALKRHTEYMKPSPHCCTGRCVCPIHATPLRYWPAGDDHACQNADCKHGQGFKLGEPTPAEMEITIGTSRISRALLDTQALLMLRYHPDIRDLGRDA